MIITLLITNHFLCGLIISYIQKKPLGCQTLLDQLTIGLFIVNILMAYSMSFIVYFTTFPLPFSPYYAQCIYFCLNFIHNIFLVWFLIFFAFKYLSIFHSHVIEFEYSDHEVGRNVSILVSISMLLLTLLEHFSDLRIEQTSMYQMITDTVHDGNEQGMPKLTKFLIFCIIVEVSFVQFTIERKGLNNIENFEVQDKKVPRIIALALVCACIFIFSALSFFDTSEKIIKFVSTIIVEFLYSILPPFFFIWRSNNQLKKHCLNFLAKLLCLQYFFCKE